MSFFHAAMLAGASGNQQPYEIEQSLRFDASSYLTRTAGSSNVATVTLSFWTKKCTEANQNQVIISGGNSSNNTCGLTFNNGKFLTLSNRESGNGNFNSQPDAEYRDPSAWYHFVQVIDFTNATQADRIRVYENGVRVSVFNFINLPTNTTSVVHLFRNGENLRIGDDAQGAPDPYPFNGYLAEFHCVDGSALDADQFGEYDDNGVWRPKRYTGSHGTEGFYLKFDPSATNGIGHDHSGNGNNFTATGFTTSGTGTDVMSDTPTTNYATLNPLALSVGTRTLSDGNLQVDLSGSTSLAVGTFEIPATGKWYWEMTTNDANARRNLGVIQADSDLANRDANRVAFWSANGEYKIESAAQTSGFSSYTDGDLVAVAIDADVDPPEIYFAKENTWQNSADPANGTNGLALTTGKRYLPEIDHGSATSSSSGIFNFGQRAFAYTPPTGFKALNTSNLPAPTIKDGSDYFNTVLWTGDGVSGRAVTGVGFQPDFLWIKRRNVAVSHYLQNSVTGATNYMFSDDTVQERNLDDSVDSFDTDGFTLGNDGGTNGSGGTYVGWNWLAGGSGSSNTAGSITSTVSANPPAGFSIVSYTGTGANATVGHGLGVAPQFFFGRNRDDTGGLLDWIVYHESIGNTGRLKLNTDGSTSTSSTFFQNTSPSSTVFSIGTSNDINKLNDDYIMYCFAEVESYSRIGSYVGNGSSDGPFIFCGFRPAYVWLKGSTFVSNWNIYDSTRDQYNITDDLLRLNSAAAEVSDYGATAGIDLLSNGFKIRTSSGDWNSSGQTFVFCAFAENPFGGSGVSPATAR